MLKQNYNEYALEQIKNNPNKKHPRVLQFKKHLELSISNLRLTTTKFPKTNVGKFANEEANKLEKKLIEAMKGIKLN